MPQITNKLHGAHKWLSMDCNGLKTIIRYLHNFMLFQTRKVWCQRRRISMSSFSSVGWTIVWISHDNNTVNQLFTVRKRNLPSKISFCFISSHNFKNIQKQNKHSNYTYYKHKFTLGLTAVQFYTYSTTAPPLLYSSVRLSKYNFWFHLNIYLELGFCQVPLPTRSK